MLVIYAEGGEIVRKTYKPYKIYLFLLQGVNEHLPNPDKHYFTVSIEISE